MRRIAALLCVAGLAAAPASAVAGPSHFIETFEWSTSKGRVGVMVMSLTPELRKHFGVPDDRGVLVAHVEPGTPAAAAGIKVGDVITEVQGRKIDGARDVLSAVAGLGKGEGAQIAVVRNGGSQTLTATLTDDALPSDWMKPLDSKQAFGSPLDAHVWFRDLFEPFRAMHDGKADDDAPAATPWICKLRDLFQLKSVAPVCQRT
jgi:membrane-associated protease RseP (regulator of RpoE activity)